MPIPDLLEKSFSIKKRFLLMYKTANAGHIGSSLSCAEILTAVFFNWMDTADEFILSKGHAAACLYSTLAEKGYISQKEIETFYQNGTYLSAHPPTGKIKKIPFATGSLGHGLSLAAGMAKAKKLKKETNRIYCLTSDGELNEGSTWEAAQFISHHRLNNVIWLIDKNNLQGFGTTEQVMTPGSLIDKCMAFGFSATEADGHDFDSLLAAKSNTLHSLNPSVIICHTIKGKGWQEEQNKLDCHYLPFRDEQYQNTLDFLQKEYTEKIKNLLAK